MITKFRQFHVGNVPGYISDNSESYSFGFSRSPTLMRSVATLCDGPPQRSGIVSRVDRTSPFGAIRSTVSPINSLNAVASKTLELSVVRFSSLDNMPFL
jgi:hypothetical protein